MVVAIGRSDNLSPEESIAALTDIIKRDPDDIRMSMMLRARLECSIGDYQSAIRDYSRLSARYPNFKDFKLQEAYARKLQAHGAPPYGDLSKVSSEKAYAVGGGVMVDARELAKRHKGDARVYSATINGTDDVKKQSVRNLKSTSPLFLLQIGASYICNFLV